MLASAPLYLIILTSLILVMSVEATTEFQAALHNITKPINKWNADFGE
jgi:hypothetical protein